MKIKYMESEPAELLNKLDDAISEAKSNRKQIKYIEMTKEEIKILGSEGLLSKFNFVNGKVVSYDYKEYIIVEKK